MADFNLLRNTSAHHRGETPFDSGVDVIIGDRVEVKGYGAGTVRFVGKYFRRGRANTPTNRLMGGRACGEGEARGEMPARQSTHSS